MNKIFNFWIHIWYSTMGDTISYLKARDAFFTINDEIWMNGVLTGQLCKYYIDNIEYLYDINSSAISPWTKFHNDAGPAVFFKDGSHKFYLHGIRYDFNGWCSKLNKSEEEKFFLKLKYSL